MIPDPEPFRVADLDVLPYGHRCELLDGVLVIGEGLTRESLGYLRHDRRRYELIEGLAIVTPAPDAAERAVVERLVAALGAGAVVAPYVVLPEDVETQPDVAVLGADGRPLLVVEVASRHTLSWDLTTKRAIYGDAGVGYWVLDPATCTLRVWPRRGDAVEVRGDEAYQAAVPFPVRVVPSALV